MAQVLVRNLDQSTVEALKRLAARRDRSLGQELKRILEEAAVAADTETVQVAERIKATLRRRGITYSDSGNLQAEHRQR
jgi:plasmid stability protein